MSPALPASLENSPRVVPVELEKKLEALAPLSPVKYAANPAFFLHC